MMFYLITKRIFACNQEANDTMKNYMINFDIRNFNAKNVSKAIINVKGIAHALGDDLPSNVVQCILVGFGRASNKVLKNLSSTSLILLGNPMYQNTMQTMTAQQQLLTAYYDLKTK